MTSSGGPGSAVRKRGLHVERLVPVAIAALVLLVAILTITPWPVGAFQDDARTRMEFLELVRSRSSGAALASDTPGLACIGD